MNSLEGNWGHARSVSTRPPPFRPSARSVTTKEPPHVGEYPRERTVGVSTKSAVNVSASAVIITKPRRPVCA